MFGKHLQPDPGLESIPVPPRLRPLDAALDHILTMRRRVIVDGWKVAYVRNLALELQGTRLGRDQQKLVAEILDVLNAEP